jgi:hypothetical protein
MYVFLGISSSHFFFSWDLFCFKLINGNFYYQMLCLVAEKKINWCLGSYVRSCLVALHFFKWDFIIMFDFDI